MNAQSRTDTGGMATLLWGVIQPLTDAQDSLNKGHSKRTARWQLSPFICVDLYSSLNLLMIVVGDLKMEKSVLSQKLVLSFPLSTRCHDLV